MAGSPPRDASSGRIPEPPGDSRDSAQLVITDRLASLGTLLASVAHEVNNPITYVLANLSELGRLGAGMREAILCYRSAVTQQLGERATELIAASEAKLHQAGGLEVLDELICDAVEGAGRIRDLVRDLLELSRAPSQSASWVDVHPVLDSALRLTAKPLAMRATLQREYGATSAVLGDRVKLAQVFLNLITNAMHACDPPDRERHRVTLRTRDTDSGIEIEVEDTGTGIPEAIRERVFEPFFTTKPTGEGTGLGLYISRRIAEEHGGSLGFRCGSAGGTLFLLRLPRGEDAAEPRRE